MLIHLAFLLPPTLRVLRQPPKGEGYDSDLCRVSSRRCATCSAQGGEGLDHIPLLPLFLFSSFHFHLQGRVAPLVVPDANGVVDVRQKNLSVANLPRLRRFKNGLNRLFCEVVRNYHLNFDLGKQIHRVLITTVKFGVSLLPAVPPHFQDRHAFHADIMQGFLDRIKPRGLNNRFDFFHWQLSFHVAGASRSRARARCPSRRRGRRDARAAANLKPPDCSLLPRAETGPDPESHPGPERANP